MQHQTPQPFLPNRRPATLIVLRGFQASDSRNGVSGVSLGWTSELQELRRLIFNLLLAHLPNRDLGLGLPEP